MATSGTGTAGQARLMAVMPTLRPELYRYCARLTGSPFDGEDVVQDTFLRALATVDGVDSQTPLRPWLFRIAHNRALDHLRALALKRHEPMDAANDVADEQAPDPAETLLRLEAVNAALSSFLVLPVAQRSAVILKDVLGHSLEEISTLLSLSLNAVKAALSRGRARLADIRAAPPAEAPDSQPFSKEVSLFAALFNRRDWDGLRALLAKDVHLSQTTRAERRGRGDVGQFFTIYADVPPVRLVPARLAGGAGPEVVAVYASASDELPAYLMHVEWRNTEIVRIRDFRYAHYILDGAGLSFGADQTA